VLLSELIPGDGALRSSVENGRAIEISGLAVDSRAVQPGYLFAALKGGQADGADFIDDALMRGAVAVLAGREAGLSSLADGVPLIVDDNPRSRLSKIAARFFGAQPRFVAAVTGTSGKTSVAEFTRQIWLSCHKPAATLGTLGVVGDGVAHGLAHTTPEPITLHVALAEIAAAGIDHLALEASSHGLDQCRLDGVDVGAAAFTNLSQDHYDYHAGPEKYLAAKLRLFETVLSPGGTAVLNADAPEFGRIASVCRARGHAMVTYGEAPSDLRLVASHARNHGQALTIEAQGGLHHVDFPLPGVFQAINALCAMGLAMASGIGFDQALQALATMKGVRGRLDLVAALANGAPVYVDYAHKPGALETVLAALRPHASGQLVVVFGCGGDRDQGKRILMGRIAAAGADRVIVTDDNPRNEDPALIRAEAMAGCPDAEEIGDRGAAITAAIEGLRAGDLLVIAGKGHESGQTIGNLTTPFDDANVARRAVDAMQRKRS